MHIPVADIFPADFYQRLQSSLPPFTAMQPLSHMTRRRHLLQLHENGRDLPVPYFWEELRGELLPKLREVLEHRFEVRGSGVASAVVYDEPGYELVPHTDMPHRLITAVFYLPADASGASQGTEILRGKHADPEGFDKAFDDRFETVATIPYLPNSALFFQRTDWSYHAVRKTTSPRWTFSFDVMR
jgi:hypothetical protein